MQSFEITEQPNYSICSASSEVRQYATGLVSRKTIPAPNNWWYVPTEQSTSVSERAENPAFTQLYIGTAIETASSLEIERVLKLYFLPDRMEVRSFLEANQFLVPLLIDAKFAIEKHFKNAVVRLVVIEDREIKDRRILSVLIDFVGSYSDNRAASRAFDAGWWFNAMPRGRGRLSIDLS
ncbi:hypothetical protein KBI23_10535 [bacterium]|nr:hypothetical protein [bacterium]MBP9809366.1 hypothetical protein [bacterium]